MKRCFFFLLCCVVLLKSYAVTDTIPIGVNLAGAEFGVNQMPGVYNIDYTYPTVAEINYYASKNIKLLRLPFRWERIQHTLNGSLDSIELHRIASFVDSCAVKGIKVILDLHNYGTYIIGNTPQFLGTAAVTIQNFSDVWKKIVTVFKTKKNIYAYNLMNEPNSLSKDVWPIAAQECIDSIREVDNTTHILISGENYSFAESWVEYNDALSKLYDPNDKIIFDAHCFFDNDSQGLYPTINFDSSGVDFTTGVDRVKPFVQWLKKNNKVGLISSFGAPANDSRWLILMDNFLKYVTANCVGAIYWAGGPWWNNYPLSIEPDTLGNDSKQMQLLSNYIGLTCVKDSSAAYDVPPVSVYPNPFTGTLTVEPCNCYNYSSLSVYNQLGRIVFTKTITTNKNTINLSFLPNGIYIVVVRGTTATYTQKIIKIK